jgi:hypothetical protein
MRWAAGPVSAEVHLLRSKAADPEECLAREQRTEGLLQLYRSLVA